MAPSLSAKLVAEFVGTYLLVFTVGCNVLCKTPVWAPVSIACVLMVSIYSLGNISGANFNPAVTLSIFLSKQIRGPGEIDGKTAAAFMATQVLAGILAAFTYAIFFWNAFSLGPSKGFGFTSAALCEFWYTFMLCFVVLNVAVSAKSEKNEWYGLAIGFVIIAGAYGAGPVSGGCFNPAVAIGIDISSAGLRSGWFIPYVLVELLAAACATVVYKGVRPSEFAAAGETAPIPMSAKLISEGLGTFMLVLTVGLNVNANSPAGAFSIAASLMCMIYALGDVSGAHFNPAVSMAIFLSGLQPRTKFSKDTMLKFMGVQVLGGICASFTYKVIYQGHAFPLEPQPGFKWPQVAVAEIIFTFVLCYVVLCVAVAETKSKDMFGLAIGSCVTVGGFAIGSISGGSLNPAVSLGIASSHSFASLLRACPYCLFEFLGAVAAAAIVMVTHGKDDEVKGNEKGSPSSIPA